MAAESPGAVVGGHYGPQRSSSTAHLQIGGSVDHATAFVVVFVTVDVELNPVLAEQRGEPCDGGWIVAIKATAVDGMVTHHHFPGGAAGRQDPPQPRQLVLPAGIHVGVEHEELHRAPPQGVPAALHAERGIGHLWFAIARADVVVAEHGMEGHLRLQQGPVGPQKRGFDPIQISIGVDVVAGHQHQIHGPALLHLDHLIGNRPLIGVATAAVGDGQPAEGGRLDRRGRQGGAGQTSPSAVDQPNQDQ